MLAGIVLVVVASLGAGFLPEVSPELTAAVEEAVEAQGRPVKTVEVEDTMRLGDDLLTVLAVGREQGGVYCYLLLLDSQTLESVLTVDYPSTHRTTPEGYAVDFSYSIDRAVSDSITLARNELDYGGHLGKVKYGIDLEQRKVLTQQESARFAVDAVAVGEGAVYCAGRLPRVPKPEKRDDWHRQHIMVVPNPAPGEYGTPVFVSEIDGREVPYLTRACDSDARGVAFEGRKARCELRDGQWSVTRLAPERDQPDVGSFTVPNAFARTTEVTVSESFLSPLIGVKGVRLLVVGEAPYAPRFGSELHGGIGVAEGSECSYYPVPIPEYSLFEKLRQDAIKGASEGYKFYMVNGVGGYEIVGDEVVFGTSFYDGEGEGGVGAIGWFNVKDRSYRFKYPQALSRWSTSVLLTDGPYLWLGLYDRPEGAFNPGGLLRYDTRDGSTTVYDVPYVIVSIVKNGDDLLMATQDGLYILSGGRILRANYTVTSEGKGATYLDRLR
ncbi:MAG: hypothetical protein GY851_18425 [bacterium]|nr:hypothetical protein [bacterium]